MAYEHRRALADRIVSQAAERGTPLDRDPGFLGLLDRWALGEIEMDEVRSLYAELASARREERRIRRDERWSGLVGIPASAGLVPGAVLSAEQAPVGLDETDDADASHLATELLSSDTPEKGSNPDENRLEDEADFPMGSLEQVLLGLTAASDEMGGVSVRVL